MEVYLLPLCECVCLHFCAFYLVILLFRKPGAEVLSSVPKCKKAVTCLMEKVQVRSTALSMGYSAVGRDFIVDKPAMYIK